MYNFFLLQQLNENIKSRLNIVNSPYFGKSFIKKAKRYQDLQKRLNTFIAKKQENPLQPVSKRDYPLKKPFINQWHMRIADDLNLVYSIRGTNLYLIDLIDHDAIRNYAEEEVVADKYNRFLHQ